MVGDDDGDVGGDDDGKPICCTLCVDVLALLSRPLDSPSRLGLFLRELTSQRMYVLNPLRSFDTDPTLWELL